MNDYWVTILVNKRDAKILTGILERDRMEFDSGFDAKGVFFNINVGSRIDWENFKKRIEETPAYNITILKMILPESNKQIKNIIEIKEEVKVGDVILEKGDKIKILKESSEFITLFENNKGMIEFNFKKDFFLATNFRESDIKQTDSLLHALRLLDVEIDFIKTFKS